MTDLRPLFLDLYSAGTEGDLNRVIERHPALADPANWRPYGGTENNYAIIENQQASPVPALVEKVTNAIDAILMRRCREEGIAPTSPEAPQTVEAAVERFFPNQTDWDLPDAQRAQARDIQVIADGPTTDTSAIVYDRGTGQRPDDFERTFLSLVRGNKNAIPFVQGKYNMGGTGALVFCGKNRYQLVGSRHHQGGPFGFTLVRRHPVTAEERETRKNTWYEYLTLDGQIPRFEVGDSETLDLGLHGRQFDTGTVIKLYSYALPSGNRTFSRDLSRSINEYLFDPALPLLMVEKASRYPNDRALVRSIYGLRRDIEGSPYVETRFTETRAPDDIGTFKATVYVFRNRAEGRSAKETRDYVRREFFKNGMTVLFSQNGQVHGHYTTEFVTRTLKYHILKSHLLIHVDCSDLRMEFRNELFMASRDRIRGGDEAARLRALLAETLKGSRLKEIYRQRRQSVAVEGDDAQDLLRSLAKNLPLNSDLVRLLDQSLRLDRADPGRAPSQRTPRPSGTGDQSEDYVGNRFPSFLQVDVKGTDEDGTPTVQVPLGGARQVTLRSDVEDEYFDRTSEPGTLRIDLLDFRSSGAGGGGGHTPSDVTEVFDVTRSSPDQGAIRVRFAPKADLSVGDAARVRATLSGAGEDFEGVFWVRVTERQPSSKRPPTPPDPVVGLPDLVTVRETPGDGEKGWADVEAFGFDHRTVMHPDLDDTDALTAVYVNLDSRVLKDYKSKRRLKSREQMETAERRYISGVYFHTLFLYALNKSRGYEIRREAAEEGGEGEYQDLVSYLKDVFESAYAEFLLNFETSELMDALE